MTLKSQILTDQSIFYDDEDFAETVTYTTPSSSADILALINRGENLAHEQGRSKIKSVVYIKKTDIAEPKYKDTITFDSFVWIVERIEQGSTIDWKVSVRRGSRTKFR